MARIRFNSRGYRPLRPFGTLSRRDRRDAVVCLKTNIRRLAPVYGGLFTSRHVLDEEGRPNLYQQWFDCYFPSVLDPRVLWNASIFASAREFWHLVSERATERAEAMMTKDELSLAYKVDLVPAEREVNGKIRSYKMQRPEPVHYDKLNGMTFREYREWLEGEIIRNDPPEVFESFSLDRGYEYGIGLRITADAPVINRASIEEVIRRFRERGEVAWRSPTPIPRERLPMVTQREAMAACEYPSVLMGLAVR